MNSDEFSPIFEGRFVDGRTAISSRVRVTLHGQNLLIIRGGDAPDLVWPLARIETGEPITARAGDVLVYEPGRAGASVFVGDAAFAKRLAAAAPRLSAGSQHWGMLLPGLLAGVAAVAIAAIIWFADFSPAKGVAQMLPNSTRVSLGKLVVGSMSEGRRVCDEAKGKAALETLAKRLSKATGTSKNFDVRVVDSEVINAFAAPGEQIVIMRGLIDKAESADEVAGVLAHEMGHGVELHPETGIVRAIGLTAITEFMLGGSGGTIANLGLMLTNLGYTRRAEKQADDHALSILKKAEIDTKGFADFFRRVSGTEKDGGTKEGGAKEGEKPGDPQKPQPKSDDFDGTLDMLRSHPSPKDRLAKIDSQPKYASTPALDVAEWRALQRICGDLPAPRRKSGGTPKPTDAPTKAPPPNLPQPKRGETGRDI